MKLAMLFLWMVGVGTGAAGILILAEKTAQAVHDRGGNGDHASLVVFVIGWPTLILLALLTFGLIVQAAS